MSKTPRTDEIRAFYADNHNPGALDAYSLWEHAEALERELAEAQKEGEEQARLNGMGSQREAKLMAERDRAVQYAGRLEEFVKLVGTYEGEGPSTTPWQTIVRDLGRWAREALAIEGEIK